jgi:hypothetical protein
MSCSSRVFSDGRGRLHHLLDDQPGVRGRVGDPHRRIVLVLVRVVLRVHPDSVAGAVLVLADAVGATEGRVGALIRIRKRRRNGPNKDGSHSASTESAFLELFAKI